MCKEGEVECYVKSLLLKPFGSRTFQEKLEVIKSERPTPELPDLKCQSSKTVRTFQSSTYSRTVWLTGCESVNKLFCWQCLLFSTEISTWRSGYCDLNNLSGAISRHNKTSIHMIAGLKLFEFGKQRIDSSINEQVRLDIIAHNQKVDKNRTLLKTLIDMVCLLAKQELPFRGHDESEKSLNRGNYLELGQFLSSYCPHLQLSWENDKIFNGKSHQIQDDLLESIGSVIKNAIKQEISDALFVAILLDETDDESKKSQLSTILRYCTKNGEVKERFIGYTDVSRDRSAAALCAHVERISNEYKIGDKLVGQGYDGAAVMAGHINGLQARVKRLYKNALFIHCNAHILNLVLSQVCKQIQGCRKFFLILNSLANFFSHSSKRTDALDEIVHRRMPRVCAVRWTSSSRLLNTVYDYRPDIIKLFKTISENENEWDDDSITLAESFTSFLTKFENLFLFELFSIIFAHTDVLYSILQTRGLDITYCKNKIEETQKFMTEKRNNGFDEVFERAEQLAECNSSRNLRSQVSFKDECKRLYCEIFDVISTQLEVRFDSLKKIIFAELLDQSKYLVYRGNFPAKQFESLQNSYPEPFDFVKLKIELTVLYKSDEFQAKSVKDIYKYLCSDLQSTFSEVHKLSALILTLPSTTVSVEASFSALKRIKDYKRNTMLNPRLNNLAIISIEKQLLYSLRCQGNFNELVLEQFLLKERRGEFIYK